MSISSIAPPSADAVPEATTVEPASKQRGRRLRTTPPDPFFRRDDRVIRKVSERSRQIAAVVLDVLAGNRSPADAATVLALSLARYYLIEQQAVAGLIEACEPRPRGPQPDPTRELSILRQEKDRLAQALLRQQALVRTGQRSLGISLPPRPEAVPTKPGKGRGKRRPTVRALRAVRRIGRISSTSPAPVPNLPSGPDGG